MKKTFLSLFALVGLFAVAGCDIVKNSQESNYIDCQEHCRMRGSTVDIDVTERSKECRCH